MQAIQQPPPSGKTAFRYGLIFGLILAAVEAVIQFINALSASTSMGATTSSGAGAQLGVALILGGIGFVLGLAAYFVAGIMAANKTGKVSTGTLAGLWTGAFYGVIGF